MIAGTIFGASTDEVGTILSLTFPQGHMRFQWPI